MRWRTIKRLWRIYRSRPFIDVSRAGWETDRPRVNVGLNSRHGTHSIFDFADDDQGNAGATLAADGLAHTLSLPIQDRRPGGREWRGNAELEASIQRIRDRRAASARLGY